MIHIKNVNATTQVKYGDDFVTISSYNFSNDGWDEVTLPKKDFQEVVSYVRI